MSHCRLPRTNQRRSDLHYHCSPFVHHPELEYHCYHVTGDRSGLGPGRWPWARPHPTSLLRITGADLQWFPAIGAGSPLVPKARKASSQGFPGLGLCHTPTSLQRFPARSLLQVPCSGAQPLGPRAAVAHSAGGDTWRRQWLSPQQGRELCYLSGGYPPPEEDLIKSSQRCVSELEPCQGSDCGGGSGSRLPESQQIPAPGPPWEPASPRSQPSQELANPRSPARLGAGKSLLLSGAPL
ncbi:hypothetical protein QTO34_007937, partial [Cnephaeus nilssonii]